MSDVIVAGVDGSPTAADAALTAARIARALDGELHVVCAYEKFEMDAVESDGREYVFSTEEAAQGLAEETLRTLRNRYPDLRGLATASRGKPAESLLRSAEDATATMIVVGNKRVQGVGRILGSIANEVAQKAHCDVYIAYTHSRD
ncbi:universal stress protein [Nocardioides immobilis]|uniref:Universal stress protein n=1 Tax=Nocardioides immobilis TaxID=2049295 RepID=A0A417XTB5_9ACTN|nr:universal stress protein [Nocardioides immobilis]RHW23744.1 universal stress protein [Nocardioides immobilis]